MPENETTWNFASIPERNAFIDQQFPKRYCTDTPGLYLLPDGSHVGVIAAEVTFYPAREEAFMPA